jgi:predicted  nucleic acid-binding Zn-ribbon protein
MEEMSRFSGSHLAVVASVRCLECGAIYPKPAGGGTVRSNPGCPECGYLGWVGVQGRPSDEGDESDEDDIGAEGEQPDAGSDEGGPAAARRRAHTA